jgi:urease accessory protein
MYLIFIFILSLALFGHGGSVPDDIFGFKSGFSHPIMGIDHLLAMLCVGMISSRIGGKAIWQIPLCFVMVMAIGCVTGFYSEPISLLEPIISFSVIIFGLLFLFPRFLSLSSTLITVAIFAFAHGFAHGKEMPIFVLPEIYILGFMASTTLIHLIGVGLGELANRLTKSMIVIRVTGLALIIAGLILISQ